MRFSLIGLLLVSSLSVACVDETSLLAAWVEYDSELTYVDTSNDVVTLSYDPNTAPEVVPITNSIVCGALDVAQSSFTLVTVDAGSEGSQGQLTATLVVDGAETALFTWSGSLVGGSKSIAFTQPALNLSAAGSQVLVDVLLSDDRSYEIRYHFETEDPLKLVQFRVVHRVIVGTTTDSCTTSSS